MAQETYDLREEINRLTTFKTIAIRILNFVMALIAFILSSPVMVLMAIAIKIDSPGPAIFKQKRIGKNFRENGHSISTDRGMTNNNQRMEDLGGKPFTFYKFRTMYVDAKERFPELYKYQYCPDEIENLYFKIPDDPRLTRLGRRLRKTTLDELPNFLNVLKGDMNFVGPRPDIPEMIKYYEGWQRKKLQVKPGITGLAQTNGRGLLSFQESLKLDVEYAEKSSLWIDFKIICKTFKSTVFRIGAF